MRVLAFLVIAASLAAADKYTGPKPPKPDVPYLLHANKLVETEMVEANSQQTKNGETYTIPGASSPAKTPLAEPILILEADKLNPNSLELFRMDVKGGNREITLAAKQGRRNRGPRPFHISVNKIGDRLYRIEASETLENGEYTLSPSDSNKAFCFEVY
jgi:hypothetical protein